MALRVEGVSKTYGAAYAEIETAAIANIDMVINDHEFVCVVGRSGCGKTTLLRMVAGLTAPTTGRIVLDDKPVRGPGPDRGVVFQDYALFAWRTAAENIAFGPKMKGLAVAERDQIVKRYVKLVGLEGFEDRYPSALSGGMQQRVAVARALANQPAALLMDEPFAAVDALTRASLQEELTKIWLAEQPMVLFVTHSVDEAVFLADRVVVLGDRPSVIVAEFRVNVDRPRRWKELIDHPAFNDLRHQVLEAIGQAAETANGGRHD